MASRKQNTMNLGTALYRYHYGLGLHAVRLLRRTGRWLY